MSTVNEDIAKCYENNVNDNILNDEGEKEGEVRTLLLVRDLYGNKNIEKKQVRVLM